MGWAVMGSQDDISAYMHLRVHAPPRSGHRGSHGSSDQINDHGCAL